MPGRARETGARHAGVSEAPAGKPGGTDTQA